MEHIIIIGAGPAGLTAAYELLTRQPGSKVTVLEASADIGGISKTVNYKGNRMDIGGHRFFSKSDRVMEWWLNMMPVPAEAGEYINIHYQGQKRSVNIASSHSDENEGTDNVMLIRNRLSRIYFLRKFFQYPVSLSVDTLKNLGLIRVSRIVSSYAWIRLKPVKPEVTLEDFFINRFGKELYLTFFKDYTEKVWGFECSKISKDWGAQRIKGLSVSKTIKHAITQTFAKKKTNHIGQKDTETSLIERFLYPKFGPGQMWELVADRVKSMGGEILMNHEVIGINGTSEQIASVICKDITGAEKEFQADRVFSTMPIKDLFEAFRFETDVHVKKIATELNYRDFITVGLLCKKLTVKDKHDKEGLIKDNWIYIQERDVRIGRLQVFNNWSPFMVKDENTVWLGLEYFCNEEDDLWSLQDEDFMEMAKDELQKIGIISKSDVLDSTIIRMKKTYPAYTGSYSEFSKVIEFLNGVKNLYPVGRNGMHKYNNSDHSMLTAMVAVDNILGGIDSKENLWKINTEEEYHEQK
jgi:protoporphyrinogen oxidase